LHKHKIKVKDTCYLSWE